MPPNSATARLVRSAGPEGRRAALRGIVADPYPVPVSRSRVGQLKSRINSRSSEPAP
jgi:hypothetical protein